MNLSWYSGFGAVALAASLSLLVGCTEQTTTESDHGLAEAVSVIVPVADCSKASEPGSAVYFAPKSAELDASAHPLLDQNVAWLFGKCSASIKLEGRTDSLGSRKENNILGQQRADAVRSYLVSVGVSESRIEAISLGEDEPICDESTKENRKHPNICRPQNNVVLMVLH